MSILDISEDEIRLMDSMTNEEQKNIGKVLMDLVNMTMIMMIIPMKTVISVTPIYLMQQVQMDQIQIFTILETMIMIQQYSMKLIE